MKGLFALFLFSTIAAFGQTDSLSRADSLKYYNWSSTGAKPGFYRTYADFKANKPVHWGAFEVGYGFYRCSNATRCCGTGLKMASKVKEEVFNLDVKYIYDGTDLFTVTKYGSIKRHVDAQYIQNKGRYGFHEITEPNQTNGRRDVTHYFIVDLQKDIVYKVNKKNLAIIFKDKPDVLAIYKSKRHEELLGHYVKVLNEELGYAVKE